jgi:hypothetical protein
MPETEAASPFAGRADPEAFNLPELLTRLPRPRQGGDLVELAELYRRDQDDRRGADLPDEVGERDRARRERVMALLADGKVATPADCYHAAMVFQHGRLQEHFHLAFELARRAAEAGFEPARWLAAAALDRWLLHRGLPQRFGTQYLDLGDGWRLYQVDPATTDQERAAWNVPPLAEARRRTARHELGGTCDVLGRQGPPLECR